MKTSVKWLFMVTCCSLLLNACHESRKEDSLNPDSFSDAFEPGPFDQTESEQIHSSGLT